MVLLKDESRWWDGDDPVRAVRGEMRESGDKVEWGLKLENTYFTSDYRLFI